VGEVIAAVGLVAEEEEVIPHTPGEAEALAQEHDQHLVNRTPPVKNPKASFPHWDEPLINTWAWITTITQQRIRPEV
jgi:hypothetical protein